jgi:membrane-associated protease RseP (regulator of RpoE activity)
MSVRRLAFFSTLLAPVLLGSALNAADPPSKSGKNKAILGITMTPPSTSDLEKAINPTVGTTDGTTAGGKVTPGQTGGQTGSGSTTTRPGTKPTNPGDKVNFDTGVAVINVHPDTAASNMGIKKGDIITKVNGRTINSMEDLRQEVSSREPGDPVEVEYLRAGKAYKGNNYLGDWPENIPWTPIDRAAEQSYRNAQKESFERRVEKLAKLKDENARLQNDIAQAEAKQNATDQGLLAKDPESFARMEDAKPARDLLSTMDKALANGALDAPINATQAPTVLPAWQLAYDLKVDETQKLVQDPQTDSMSPVQVALAGSADDQTGFAVSFHYGFSVQDR